MAEPIVVLHDVSSAQRLIDMAKLVYGMGFRQLVVTKAYGAASSSGIPEASRLALKQNKGFTVLPSLRDFVDIFKPDVLLVVSREYGEPLEVEEIVKRLEAAQSAAIVFGGIEPAPGKDAAAMGEAVYIRGAEARLGPVAEAAIILYALRKRQNSGQG